MNQARILVADDHPLMRDGIALAINGQPDLCVCGEADSHAAVFRAVETLKPDVLVMDLFLGKEDGLATVKSLLGPWPDLKILIVSMQSETLYAPRCWKAGARGYVSKLEPAETLLSALRDVHRGRLHFSAGIVATGRADGGLTDRELQILKLIADGLKSSEIAAALGISPRTVDTHRENLKEKLGLSTSAQLVLRAAEYLQGASTRDSQLHTPEPPEQAAPKSHPRGRTSDNTNGLGSAVVFALVEGCRRQDIEPFDYLLDILTDLAPVITSCV